MSFNFVELDATTRQYMLEELQADLNQNNILSSDRLNTQGRLYFPDLLRQAFDSHDDAWLVDQLRQGNLFNETEQKRKHSGGYTTARVPKNAADVLGEGEFNRFYIRAICRRALSEGVEEVEAYRAKMVSQSRPETQAKIGQKFNARSVLDDLRANVGIDTVFGLPSGPNSGLSVRLPRGAR